MTLTKEILEQENLVASERELVITTGCLIVEDLEKKLKNKRKRFSRGGWWKGDDDDDDVLDNNDDRIYRDSQGNIIPTFKAARYGTLSQVLGGTYDVKGLWEGGVRDESPTTRSSDLGLVPFSFLRF